MLRLMVLGLCCAAAWSASAATPSWTNSASGPWQGATNWSTGTAPGSGDTVLITNATTKTVTIDSLTPSGNLTINNLTVQAPSGSINTLLIDGATSPLVLTTGNGSAGIISTGPGGVLQITNATVNALPTGGANLYFNGSTIIDAGGSLIFTNANAANVSIGRNGAGVDDGSGALTVNGGLFWAGIAGNMAVGYDAGRTGTVLVTGGQLVSTNVGSQFIIGQSGVGQMTISNGTVNAYDVRMGSSSGGAGTLNIAGGQMIGRSDFGIGHHASGTGTVLMTGGSLVVTNSGDILRVGASGFGTMTISNGTVTSGDFRVGSDSGSRGVLNMAGGTNVVIGGLNIGTSSGATGQVTMTGGQMIVTNAFNFIGNGGVATFVQSGGTVQMSGAVVGGTGVGTLTISNGVFDVKGSQDFLFVGNSVGSTGTLNVSGGTLLGTNATSALIGRNGVGRLNLSSGTVNIQTITLGSDSSTGHGTLTVSGGLLTNAALTVGSAGTGMFTVKGANGMVKLTSYTQNGTSTFNPTLSSAGVSPVTVSGSATHGGALDIDLDGGIALFQTNAFLMMRKVSGSFGGSFATTEPSVFTVATATDGADAVLTATLNVAQQVTTDVLGSNVVEVTFSPSNKGYFEVGTNIWGGLTLQISTNGATKTVLELAQFMQDAGYQASTGTVAGTSLFLNLPQPTTLPSYFAWDFTSFDSNLQLFSVNIPEPSAALLGLVGLLLMRRRRGQR